MALPQCFVAWMLQNAFDQSIFIERTKYHLMIYKLNLFFKHIAMAALFLVSDDMLSGAPFANKV